MPIFILISFALAAVDPAPPSNQHLPSQIQVERLQGALGAAPPTMSPRPLSALALKMIQDFEGWSTKAYDDSAGYCTIGFGHLIALKRCAQIDLGEFSTEIDETRGAQLLEEDTAYARISVQKSITNTLSSDEFGALTSFVFNVGSANFRQSHLRELAQSGETKLASREFGRWILAGGKVQAGLVERRRCEATMFRGQLTTGLSGKFDRNGCASLGIASATGNPIDIYKGERK